MQVVFNLADIKEEGEGLSDTYTDVNVSRFNKVDILDISCLLFCRNINKNTFYGISQYFKYQFMSSKNLRIMFFGKSSSGYNNVNHPLIYSSNSVDIFSYLKNDKNFKTKLMIIDNDIALLKYFYFDISSTTGFIVSFGPVYGSKFLDVCTMGLNKIKSVKKSGYDFSKYQDSFIVESVSRKSNYLGVDLEFELIGKLDFIIKNYITFIWFTDRVRSLSIADADNTGLFRIYNNTFYVDGSNICLLSYVDVPLKWFYFYGIYFNFGLSFLGSIEFKFLKDKVDSINNCGFYPILILEDVYQRVNNKMDTSLECGIYFYMYYM